MARDAGVEFTESASGASYNVDTGLGVTIAELADHIVEGVNPDLGIAFQPERPSGQQYRVASIDRINEPGFNPQLGLREGIRRTVEWFRAGR